MPTQRRDRAIQVELVAWGRANLRDLPWRRTRDPWTILVSEVMLQQTQVARIVDRLPRFLARFPTPSACAAASAGHVVEEWAGLGYNRRALNLHRAAVAMAADHDGEVPSDLGALLALPGIGPYTARAVRAFAFELPAAVVDTNIGRVLARLDNVTLSPGEAQERADVLAAAQPVWLWNQSLMELGAQVCTKRAPACELCPIAASCRWRGSGADPAVGSAGVSAPQAPFAGSDRQLRGQLVDALRAAPVAMTAVPQMLDVPAERARRVVAGLVRDGLAVEDGRKLRLP
ncbi:MAG: A/G-specific adenine glycosylase [Acidimicrobiales bacterium]